MYVVPSVVVMRSLLAAQRQAKRARQREETIDLEALSDVGGAMDQNSAPQLGTASVGPRQTCDAVRVKPEFKAEATM